MKTISKNTAKFFAAVLAVMMLASAVFAFPAFAENEEASEIETEVEAEVEAEAEIEAEAETEAEEKAAARGAKGEITVSSEVHTKETVARGLPVYIGTTVTAHAAGAMGF